MFLGPADVDRLMSNLPDAAALRAGSESTRAADTRPPVACPTCRGAMQRHHVKVAGVDVDRCAAHGTFYDRGEVERVVEALRATRWRGGAPPGGAPRADAPKAEPAPESKGSGVDAGDVAVGVFGLIAFFLD
jgi:Zn-finger nucleic acid-binding protein